MAQSAALARPPSTTPTMIVDLDALSRGEQLLVSWVAPVVVDGEIVVTPVRVSPLDPDSAGRYPTRLRGGVVTDPDEVDAIRMRVQHATRPSWAVRVWHRVMSARCGTCEALLYTDGTCPNCDRAARGR